MKAKILTTLVATCFASSALAQELEVKITNLTHGIYYTPLLVTAHAPGTALFSLGETASEPLQAMAEGGDISGLSNVLESINADMVMNPAGGLLAPASSTMAMLSTSNGNTYLSLVAMMLPTNDGFVGLNSWPIPTEAGTYEVYLNAYDAGTEANNELVVDGSGAPGMPGIPASPGVTPGSQGLGITNSEENNTIHIHRGNVGDDEQIGGASDLHNTVHRWLNPVAKLTITVK
ncbi:spondin domain-containing protein [Pseudoalteromonas sp. SCSIO 43201]|uniref:spondin domain-containing protein n=1 Tax=Pseudoalteromonas sp. SCSIO 43201 TaxID=2822842 RepID=UPI0020763BF3|nr:spondin domain-containing protein [Pseudoalteromonas sp. SCSIO 43201]USD29444.1 spondin domain-containing protein [Pseudoalteromonas sp. SCSIO 43201]